MDSQTRLDRPDETLGFDVDGDARFWHTRLNKVRWIGRPKRSKCRQVVQGFKNVRFALGVVSE